MSEGKGAFTDRYGDYKQPSIIDMDKEYGKKKSYEKGIILEGDTYKEDLVNWRKESLSFILDNNPFYLATEFSDFILREEGKLVWNKPLVTEACKNDKLLGDMSLLMRKRIEINLVN